MSQFQSNAPGLPQPQAGNWVAAVAPEESESKFDFWGLLNRRKWLIFLGLITGVGVGLVYHYNTPPTYESVAEISIEPKNPAIIALNSSVGNTIPNSNEFGIRHDKVIDSPVFIMDALSNDNLFNRSMFTNLTEADAVALVSKNLEVVPDREEPRKFQLRLKGSDKTDTQAVLTKLLLEYEQKLKKKYQQETDSFVTNIKAATQQVFEQLESAKGKYDAIRKSFPYIDLGNRLALEKQKLIAVDGERESNQEAIYQLLTERGWILDALENGSEEIDIVWRLKVDRKLPSDTEDRSYAVEQKKIADTENLISITELQMAEQMQTLGVGHPKVQALQRQLDYYRALLDNGLNPESGSKRTVTVENMVRNYLSQIELNLQTAQIKQKALDKQFEKLKREVIEINNGEFLLEEQQKEITMIQDWLKIQQSTLATIDPDHLNNLAQSDKDGYYFETLARPKEGAQVWPYIPAILAIGGMLGMLSGFGLGYLVDIADKTYRNPDEITKQLNLPLIGHIPIISSSKRNIAQDSYIHPLVCTYHRPKSQSAEAFRAVRTALFFNSQGRDHNVIQVTSPTPGDGKSTCAVNIAVSIAQSGKRVLLIDADMRRPTVHHSFGIKSNEGFATALSGDSRIDDVIFECEEIEGMSVMPCGRKPTNPAELLTSPRFQSLMEEVRQLFDFVIIDTPPVLAVTDPCPIAARVDGVILTLRIKKNIKISSDRAAEILQNVGGHVIGVVVNGVGANTGYGSQYSYGAYRAGYSYNGYGYGYGYGYGSYYEDKNQGPAPKGSNVSNLPNIAHQPADVGAPANPGSESNNPPING